MTTSTATARRVGPDPAAVAKRLRVLADHHSLAGRKTGLTDLARSVDAKTADGWEAVDLLAALGYQIPIGPVQASLGRRLVDLVRIACVFLPIAVTWFGLAEAAGAYETLLRRGDSPEAQSFFRLWLTGFDGELVLTFRDLALITVALIAILIVSNVWAQWYDAQQHTKLHTEHRLLRDDLNDVLTAAGRLVNRNADPATSVADELPRLVNDVRSLVEQVTTAAGAAVKTLNTSVTAAADGVAALHGAATAARDAAASIGTSTTDLAGVARGISAAIQQNEVSTAQLLKDAQTRGEATANVMTAAVERSVATLAAAAEGVHKSVEHHAASSDDSRENIGRLLSDHESFLKELVADFDGQPSADRAAAFLTVLEGLREAVERLNTIPLRDRKDEPKTPLTPVGPDPRPRFFGWFGR